MKLEILKPNKILNKAYFKQSLNRDDIELFKKSLIRLFARINDSESEEHNKNIVSDFLKDTFYKTDYEINTAGRKDLVIHLGKTSSEPVAVIIEAKRPDDKAGMITSQKANAKSVHELIHYYLHERFIKNNKEIRNLIITDIYQWYIFDSTEFERICNVQTHGRASLLKTYQDWHNGILPSKNTDWFYQEIAKPFIDKEILQLNCTYFNLREYESIITNNDKTDDTKLIDLYKVLSPRHLLKLPHLNDSNELNKDFYNELLHLIGLYEHKESSKKIIDRLPENLRNSGSLLENTISILKTYNKLSNIEKISQFGENEDEQLFSVALELCITWLNRILFLKLLEGQLLKYNNNNEDFAFLNIKRIKDFDELSELFFDVLAIKTSERTKDVKEKYAKIPYLNSSLFEQTPLEQETICINQLKDRFEIPIFTTSVLKDETGKRQSGTKAVLSYLFEFLDSYNFASENTASIQEQNKSIINASVLGLIFEKINGYKDGSFFTPGYITMYMCRNTIRNSVLNKFNETYRFNCPDFDSLTNYLSDFSKLKEYNQIVNSIRLCDPAVGSGHFLVSALNEIIALKSDLGILCDQQYKRIKFHFATVENDELIITDEDNQLFVYNFQNKESQRIQETLFQEKQTIIENCLFGVDINPKSVHICRLRLWIELLKNSYYTKESNYTELETLPNIDINIKCGNSLISRFALNGAGLKNGQLKQMQIATQKYKDQVIIYKSTQDKKTKKNAEKEIAKLKQEFAKIVNPKDKDYIELQKIESELASQTLQFSREDVEKWKIRTEELTTKKIDLQAKYEEKLHSIYGNSFEWRFEFPEVLDENGNFIGFDVIIGNPPYINVVNLEERSRNFYQANFTITKNKVDLYAYFIEQAAKISKSKSNLAFIIPHTWKATESFQLFRQLLIKEFQIDHLVNLNFGVFEAIVKPMIIVLNKPVTENYEIIVKSEDFSVFSSIKLSEIKNNPTTIFDTENNTLVKEVFNKIENNTIPLESVLQFTRGIKTSDDNRFVAKSKINDEYKKVFRGRNIKAYQMNWDNEWIWYRPDLMREKVGCLPHTKDLFEVKEKLITQRVNSSMQLLVAYDTGMNYFLDTTNVSRIETLNKKYLMKYIAGLLNSKLINFWYCNKYRMPTIGLYELHSIPVKEATKKDQEKIVKLVDKILVSQNNETQISSLKKQIDEIIYNLYGIEPEDVKIIENE